MLSSFLTSSLPCTPEESYLLFFGWAHDSNVLTSAEPTSTLHLQEPELRAVTRTGSAKKKKKTSRTAGSSVAAVSTSPRRLKLHSLSWTLLCACLGVCGFGNVLWQLLWPDSADKHAVLSVIMALACAAHSVLGAVTYARFVVHLLQRDDSSSRMQTCSLGALAALYAHSAVSFAALYFTLLLRSSAPAFTGLNAADGGLANLAHTLYFSAATLTTTGFGDCAALSAGARLCVTAQMAQGVILNAIILGRAVDIVISRKQSSSEQAARGKTGVSHAHAA